MRQMILAVLLGTALLLAGCSTTDGTVTDEPTSGTNADEEVPLEDDTDQPDEEESEPAPATPSFGESYVWDNGLTVTVSEPKKYQPSEWAAGAEGPGTALRFTVVVVNGTDAPYDVVGDYVTLQSGNEEAEPIFDSEKGVMGQPNTKVLPDREAKFDIAFQAKSPKDLVMEYQPADWELASVIFVS